MNEIQLGVRIILAVTALVLVHCQNHAPTPTNASSTFDSTFYAELHRPQFHFSPEKMWMNDPNGMVFFEGEYHLFYQHYPDSNVWGPMHWAHAVSNDLVHWQHLPIALFPDSLGYIFSGSAAVDWQNTTGFGHDGKPPLVAMFTYHDMKKEVAGSQEVESQGIAYSNDNGRTWQKFHANPVLPNPATGKDRRDFRDPKIMWHEPSKHWVTVLAVGNHIEFWTSPDLKKWTHQSNFGEKWGTHGGVWECPDLFELPIEGTAEKRWVLLVSFNPGGPNGGSATQYFVGNFDGKKFTLDPSFESSVAGGKAVFLDFGKDNYAGVTWSDVPAEDGRRILLGWMSNWQYAQVVPTQRWRSAMTLPRSLHLLRTTEGVLLASKPVAELQKLRKKEVDLPSTDLDDVLNLTQKMGCSPPLLELDLEFELPTDGKTQWGIELSNSKNEHYRLGYNAATGQFFSDRTRTGKIAFSPDFAPKPSFAPRLSNAKTLRLHVFFDVASAELFADDGSVTMTEIFFPTENFNQISLFAENGTVRLLGGKCWQLDNIWH